MLAFYINVSFKPITQGELTLPSSGQIGRTGIDAILTRAWKGGVLVSRQGMVSKLHPLGPYSPVCGGAELGFCEQSELPASKGFVFYIFFFIIYNTLCLGLSYWVPDPT